MTEVPYSSKIKPEHLARKAIVYLRQSSENRYGRIRKSEPSVCLANGSVLWLEAGGDHP